MPMIPFIGGSYEHRSRKESSQRSLNLYPEIVGDKDAKHSVILIGTPGTEVFSTVTSSTGTAISCRGLYTTTFGTLYTIFENKLYEVSSNGTATVKGVMTLSANKVSMIDNGVYLLIADGIKLYKYKFTDETLSEISLDFDNPTLLEIVGGRAIITNTSNDISEANRFYYSEAGPEGFVEFPALNFYTAESNADPIISMAKKGGELWLYGSRSYEVWQFTGDLDDPFNKVGGSDTEIGIGAIYSTAAIADNIFWLGSSTAGQNQIYVSNGYGARRISNHAIEFELNEITKASGISTSDAIGFTYQQEGHVFYVLNLISGNKTLVYDLTTGYWHERSTRDPNRNTLNRWDPIFAQYAYDKVIVGNSRGANLLLIDLDKYDEWDSRPIVRIRQSPVYWNELSTLFHKTFILDMETGVGLQNNTSQGFDPKIMLQYSDDGGHTWSSERWRSLGKIGNYRLRVKWRMLGRSSERVYRLQVSDPIKVVFLAAKIDTVASVNP
jgi:hypothetical protein